ncbi:MAG: hypothetical protein JO246_09730, partial [Frankiaceae bacterium]|nr:hypothetical protein [Frankiaceae bacterium]
RRVLDAWRDSPARFRADANVEDDLSLTGYRDRVIIELAQNASDAATRAGIRGRLEFTLDGQTLTATNTGAPLDAAGVESISVARASSKVDDADTVGRFGVGFAAVLSVTDLPAISSTTGSVRWSRLEARSAVAEIAELEDELIARGNRVPVLRLPFSSDAPATLRGTTVTLPLRDVDAFVAVRSQLDGLDPMLLLTLPGLGEIVIRTAGGVERTLTLTANGDHVVLHDGGRPSHWRIARGEGQVPAELLADRPLEEQRFAIWAVTWAIPVDADDRVVALPAAVPQVVRAPTVTDDPLTIPAVLIATYPLDATRRRITGGDLAGAVTARAADVLARTMAKLPADPGLSRLVPVGFPNGEIDGSLHAAILDRLAETAWLPVAGDEDARQRPREAVLVADPLVGVLRGRLPCLLPAGWEAAELGPLGVQRPQLADLIDDLRSIQADPAWWQRLYAALAEVVPAGPERDALGAVPVPLTDGSLAVGPRGLVLPDPSMPAVDLSPIGVRLVHPDAAHDLLRSFGAIDGAARDLLDQPQVQAAVEASYDEPDPEPIAVAVLTLLAATAVGSGELPWLADLALTDTNGEWGPAGELVVPDGVMAALIAADSAFGVVNDRWVEQFGRAAVVAAGVLDGPVLLRASDAVGPTHDLDAEAEWWATLPPDCAVEEFVAIRDLEQLEDDALETILTRLDQPGLRAQSSSRRSCRGRTAAGSRCSPTPRGGCPHDRSSVAARRASFGCQGASHCSARCTTSRPAGTTRPSSRPSACSARWTTPTPTTSWPGSRTRRAWSTASSCALCTPGSQPAPSRGRRRGCARSVPGRSRSSIGATRSWSTRQTSCRCWVNVRWCRPHHRWPWISRSDSTCRSPAASVSSLS